MKKGILVALIVPFIVACSGVNGVVIPKENGLYSVEAFGYSETESKAAALELAKKECKSGGYQVSGIKTDYMGQIDEQINKQVLAAASIVALTTGQYYGSLSTNEDYKTELNFTCKA